MVAINGKITSLWNFLFALFFLDAKIRKHWHSSRFSWQTKAQNKRSNTAAKTTHKFSLSGKALQYRGFFHLLKLCCDLPLPHLLFIWRSSPKMQGPKVPNCCCLERWHLSLHPSRTDFTNPRWVSFRKKLCSDSEPDLSVGICPPSGGGGGGTGSWGLVRMRQHAVYFALAPLQPALVEEAAANTQQQLCARDLVLFFLTPAIA